MSFVPSTTSLISARRLRICESFAWPEDLLTIGEGISMYRVSMLAEDCYYITISRGHRKVLCGSRPSALHCFSIGCSTPSVDLLQPLSLTKVRASYLCRLVYDLLEPRTPARCVRR